MSAAPPNLTRTVQLLANINRLTLKAVKVKNKEELIFLILNDTVPIVKYDRAVLWEMDTKPPKLLGISGQASVVKHTDISKHWLEVVKKIQDPSKVQVLDNPELGETTSVLWLPIFSREKLALGLWLERWNNVTWSHDEIEILSYLMQSYGAAWERFSKRFSMRSFLRYPIPLIAGLILLGTLFIRIPLRVAAPCEVVPKEPIVITAPLEGIIEMIVVKPGQHVEKNDLLFEYDKRVPLHELQVAKKKVEIVESEVDRAMAQAIKDKKALAELAIENLKLKKEKLALDIAEYHASKLDVAAPEAGVALLDNPEEWRGKPVKIGEKVLVIANPNQTKVRLWIPEDDNVQLNIANPIKIFLNIRPEYSYQAKIIYIASYTTFNEKQIQSFVAEAEWVDPPTKDIKLGLKGTAILYGEDVSIFYWIIRKPWSYLRHFFGI